MTRATRLWTLSAGFGGLLFAVNFSFGAGLAYATGNPGMSGLVTGLTTSFIFFLLVRLTERFGAVTIAFTLYCILAIPTVLMGPPGVYKVLVGLAAGLVIDLFLKLGGYRFGAYLLGFIAYVGILLAGTYAAFLYYQFPTLETFRKLMIVLAAVFAVEGWLGALLAQWFFRARLEKLPVVERLRLRG